MQCSYDGLASCDVATWHVINMQTSCDQHVASILCTDTAKNMQFIGSHAQASIISHNDNELEKLYVDLILIWVSIQAFANWNL